MFEVRNARCIDLISNPIMLILSLIVFMNENKLPHAKIEFYKKCIKTFLSEREERKEAYNIEPIANIYYDELVMPKIAFYKYCNERDIPDYKFSFEEIKALTFKAIEIDEKDKSKWMAEVTKFVTYLIERTELIKEVDLEKYDFSHKSFRDYFLAVYYSKCLSHESLISFIKNSLGDANYHELAILIIQYIGKECLVTPYNSIIEFLLAELEKMDDFKKVLYNSSLYMLRILEDLYSDNALPIKYHDRFITIYLKKSFILLRRIPSLVFKLENFKKLYRAKFNEVDLKFKLESIWNFNRLEPHFREDISKNDLFMEYINSDIILTFFTKLMKLLHVRRNVDNIDIKSLHNEIKYFINNYREIICKNDLLYLIIVTVCVRIIKDANLYKDLFEELLKTIAKLTINITIMSNIAFNILISESKSSADDYAIFLTVAPKSIRDIKSIFITFNRRKTVLKKANEQETLLEDKDNEYYEKLDNIFSNYILHILDGNTTYEELVTKIKSKNLYSEKYEELYKYIFTSINKDRLQRYKMKTFTQHE